jgi:uncharacterized membrane protein
VTYLILKYLHIVGASVLLGTGAGIAFFMLLAHRTGDPRVIAGVARIVVIADYLFTASAVVLQPVTGAALVWLLGYSFLEGWIFLSLLLYAVTGAFWLPVVRLQTRMRDLASTSAEHNQPLSGEYHRYFRMWFAFGFPAFASVLAIFWLMIARPSIQIF